MAATPFRVDVGENVPQALPEQPAPDALQFTPVGSLVVETTFNAWPVTTAPFCGETATLAYTVRCSVAEALCAELDESIAVTVSAVEFAAEAGVPLMVPALVLSDRPVGRLPLSVHVYGALPPLALSVAVYGAPMFPLGRVETVIVTGVGADAEPPPHPARTTLAWSARTIPSR